MIATKISKEVPTCWEELKSYSECRNQPQKMRNGVAGSLRDTRVNDGASATLERTLCDRFKLGLSDAWRWERCLSRVHAKARGFLPDPPSDTDHMEWLASCSITVRQRDYMTGPTHSGPLFCSLWKSKIRQQWFWFGLFKLISGGNALKRRVHYCNQC
jgi:hypothetical protein